jgi:putative ABC transport system permease protein
MSHVIADLSFGLRLLRRSPLTTIAAVLSLGLGIGGTTVMFSAVDAVLLRPLPYADAHQLVRIHASSAIGSRIDLSPGDFQDYRLARSFDGVASMDAASMSLTGDGQPEQVRAQWVSGNFFTLLGTTPIAGRVFLPIEDRPGAPPAAILGEGLWKRRYGGAPSILGRTIVVGGHPVEVVGVVPAAFRFDQPADLWLLGDRGVPRYSQIPGDLAENRDIHTIAAVGRLRPGVTLAAAQVELAQIAARLAREYPRFDTGWSATAEPLQAAVVGDSWRILVVLLAAVALLLLIAAVNVANLLLVRTQARSLELAMRSALGADRRRLASQVLVESFLIALFGGVVGLLVASWGVDLLVRLAPGGLPRTEEIALNGRMFAFALLTTAATGLTFGMWPAWRASRTSHVAALGAEARGQVGRERRGTQYMLVGSELAIAQVLLVGAGLLLASLTRLLAVDPGFDPRGLVAVNVSLPGAKYADPVRKVAFHRAVVDGLSGLPDTTGVAMAMRAPMTRPIDRGVRIEGRPEPRPGEMPTMSYLTVSDRYFEVTGIRLMSGRSFTAQDDGGAIPVAIVNEAFVRRYFPGEEPIGRRIGYGDPKQPWYWRTIVGVAHDTRDGIAQAPAPLGYSPVAQDREPWNFASYLIKSPLPTATVGDRVRRAVLAVDPDQPVARVRAVEDDMRSSIAVERFTTLVASLFAGLALLLAAVGTFGVMSHVVASRTRELGIRLAIGATPRDVVRLVIGGASRLVATATIVGLVASALLGRWLSALLFEVAPSDPATILTATGVLVVTALAASYLPLRRALANDPMGSLRR